MASDNLDRLVEKITQQPKSDDTFAIFANKWKSNQERFSKLKDAVQRAVEEMQRRTYGSDNAVKLSDLVVRSQTSDTMSIEKAESPYIDCVMKVGEDNASIQVSVRAAKNLPDSHAVVEAHLRIGLTTKNGKPSYSFNGKTFSNVDSLAEELLTKIIETSNQQPTVVSMAAANHDLEMKRGQKAMAIKWNQNLKARQKRERNARAGR